MQLDQIDEVSKGLRVDRRQKKVEREEWDSEQERGTRAYDQIDLSVGRGNDKGGSE